nr:unnamed protein product [Callosobruchus analis]
MSGLNLKKRI